MPEEYFLEKSPFHFPQLNIPDESKRNKILESTKPFRISKEKLTKLKTIFTEEIDLGLKDPSAIGTPNCSLKMINTFITHLPNDKEEGDFLSLDLGSTNFRVCLSRLKPGKGQESQFFVKHYDVPDHLRHGKAVWFFDHIAECVEDFLKGHPYLKDRTIPLGFTFSYPTKQTSLDRGILIAWTKSYDIKDAVNKDAAKLLQDAIDRKKIKVKVAAIINDSTGTLVKGVYMDHDCAIGCIVGSGFNCAYIEKANKVHFYKEISSRPERVLINIECGGFGDNNRIDFVKTDVDFAIDKDSLFPGSFSYEKLFSGVFLGDIVRRIMLDLARKGLLFEGKVSENLVESKSFTSPSVSQIEVDSDGSKTREILGSLGYKKVTADDLAVVRYLCALISVRAATLISALLSVLITKINRKCVKVAFDGSLYNKHPRLKTLLTDFIAEMTPGQEFGHFLAEDGSGHGAGLVVAALYRDLNNKENLRKP